MVTANWFDIYNLDLRLNICYQEGVGQVLAAGHFILIFLCHGHFQAIGETNV